MRLSAVQERRFRHYHSHHCVYFWEVAGIVDLVEGGEIHKVM